MLQAASIPEECGGATLNRFLNGVERCTHGGERHADAESARKAWVARYERTVGEAADLLRGMSQRDRRKVSSGVLAVFVPFSTFAATRLLMPRPGGRR